MNRSYFIPKHSIQVSVYWTNGEVFEYDGDGWHGYTSSLGKAATKEEAIAVIEAWAKVQGAELLNTSDAE